MNRIQRITKKNKRVRPEISITEVKNLLHDIALVLHMPQQQREDILLGRTQETGLCQKGYYPDRLMKAQATSHA